MAQLDYWKNFEPGQVIALKADEDPPTSTLVEALRKQGLDAATDAIVLRGYLGRSDIVPRVLDYLRRVQQIEEQNAETAALDALKKSAVTGAAGGAPNLDAELAASVPVAQQADSDAGIDRDIAMTIRRVESFEQSQTANRHIPWRLYLTPRLDTYVDFHRSSLLAYRRDARTERQDACTVWLRVFEDGSSGVPIPYRVVQETMLGPSFAMWLDGAVVDDYVEQRGSVGSAWADQSAVFGNRAGTSTRCAVFGRKAGTGTVCGE